jgi:ZIP family zinc transporter
MRFRDRLHLISGFGAGALIGVAFFDLLPSALTLGAGSSLEVMTVAAAGYAAYLIIDRFVAPRHAEGQMSRSRRGALGASSLSIHSFLDGCAIGLAFKVSGGIGAVVAVAVLAHDFADGINTVGVVLRHDGDRRSALRWLLIDAVAPVFGAVSTLALSLPAPALGLALALFAGFFLYIGASDLLPESYHNHPSTWTTVATLAGIGVLYVLVRIAGAN